MLPAEGGDTAPLSEQLFATRLELLQQLDAGTGFEDERVEVAGVLHETVASMNPDNFIVRPHLALVEKFGDAEAWSDVSIGDLANLANTVAKLPAQLEPEAEESKRFDVLVLNGELALLRGEALEPIRNRIVRIAGLLEDQQSIPVVAAQLALIQDVQTDEWWVDVTYGMLEEVRKKLRALVPLIERAKKGIVYIDVDDLMGEGSEIELPGVGSAGGPFELLQFERKARTFLRNHLGEIPIIRVRSGAQLTQDDFADLQRLLVAGGIGDTDTFAAASQRAGNFGLFVRSLVGLDRAAAKKAFNDFLDDKRYSRTQIDFVNMVIDYLTEHGALEVGRVYHSPFTDVAPAGPDAIFTQHDTDRLFEALERLTASAATGDGTG